MPENHPIVSSAAREPEKRPRPIPAKVKAAIRYLVRGHDDDADARPMNLLDAAKAAGITPYVLRRYFDRPTVIAFLRAERRSFREMLCSANEASLRDIRDLAENSMARVAAIRQLENLSDEAERRGAELQQSPGITIEIINIAPAPNPAGPIIDVALEQNEGQG